MIARYDFWAAYSERAVRIGVRNAVMEDILKESGAM